MIAYVDQPPQIEPHNGHFLLKFTSGADQIAVLMSRNSLMMMGVGAKAAAADAFARDAEVVPFEHRAAGKPKAGNESARLP